LQVVVEEEGILIHLVLEVLVVLVEVELEVVLVGQLHLELIQLAEVEVGQKILHQDQ
jgi:hypothetical protein